MKLYLLVNSEEYSEDAVCFGVYTSREGADNDRREAEKRAEGVYRIRYRVITVEENVFYDDGIDIRL